MDAVRGGDDVGGDHGDRDDARDDRPDRVERPDGPGGRDGHRGDRDVVGHDARLDVEYAGRCPGALRGVVGDRDPGMGRGPGSVGSILC